MLVGEQLGLNAIVGYVKPAAGSSGSLLGARGNKRKGNRTRERDRSEESGLHSDYGTLFRS
jgi:hypothetical protein